MTLVSRILVPAEFSLRCQGAAQYAETLASHFHCETILLHVVGPPLSAWSPAEGMGYSSVAGFLPETVEQRRIRLDAFAVGESPDISIERAIV
jgi:nucleotide-binding universal stress UspA family protein